MFGHAPLLLLVEDTPPLARAFVRRASAIGWKTLHAATLPEARELVGRVAFEAWVVDRDVRGEEGLALVREHEQVAGSTRRRRRPRTALWTSVPADAPADVSDYGIAVFAKTDVDPMLTWLAAGLAPVNRRAVEAVRKGAR